MSARRGVSDANRFYFYIPPAARKRQQMTLLQQQQREREESETSADSEKVSQDCLSTSSSRTDSGCSISRQAIDCATNLDRFLQNTIPVLVARCSSKKSVKGRKGRFVDSHIYYILDDLWESFKEWSAYGAGVPILLNDSEPVVQYYVPFLSAIQLYVDPSRPSSGISRGTGGDSDVGSARETSSEASSDRDAERGDVIHNNQSRGPQNGTETDVRNRVSLKSKTSVDASSSEGKNQNAHGALAFEFFERQSPFVREPLANKVSLLASRFPGLKTYRSCDLLPQSWLSVAWYPIYRIPTGPTLQNVDACFLTYHYLSTPLLSKGAAAFQGRNSRISELHRITSQKFTLTAFALASYRLKASVWESDRKKEQLLLKAAGDWLKLRQVEHPDYGFFMTNYISPLLR